VELVRYLQCSVSSLDYSSHKYVAIRINTYRAQGRISNPRNVICKALLFTTALLLPVSLCPYNFLIVQFEICSFESWCLSVGYGSYLFEVTRLLEFIPTFMFPPSGRSLQKQTAHADPSPQNLAQSPSMKFHSNLILLWDSGSSKSCQTLIKPHPFKTVCY
jgi:hypothetical protein